MRLALAVVVGAVMAPGVAAQDTFYVCAVGDLRFEGGASLPSPGYPERWEMGEFLHPYAVLDSGEAFVVSQERGPGWDTGWNLETGVVAARVPAGAAPSGVLYVPDEEWKGLVPLRFAFEPGHALESARERYFSISAEHYERLVGRTIPGGAYFRWRADEARRILKEEYGQEPPQGRRPFAAPDLDDTYNLFTGGRAASENLQLPRDITAVQRDPLDEQMPPEELVPVATIEGVTVREMDFRALLGEAEPALDPLAAAVPADQHAVFFPSFAALAAVAGETSEEGLPVFRGLRARSEDAGLVARYEMQLGLSTRGLARLMGPLAVRSVAVTGSDPYFPTGTDVALLFESPNPEGLVELLAAQALLARGAAAGVEKVRGEAGGVAYTGLVTADRAVSSYIAVVGQVVVATNSLHQLERLGEVAAGAPALASLDEYRFFRMRYQRGHADESALAILPDGAIRRWCGAEWRIGASRRLRAAAVLSDITAEHAAELVAGVGAPRAVTSGVPMRTIGETMLTLGGARSSVYNTLAFLTPIAELGITDVTRDEAAAYGRWRDTYQANWRWAFDPIAIRLGVREDRLAADVTVMPVIFATKYATWMTFSQGAKIGPQSGDPHDTLAHVVAAVNPESPSLKQATGLAMMMAPGIEADPLGWLGQTVALYADPDPFWGEMLSAEGLDWFGENVFRAPIGLRAEVKSPLRLTAFLASARAFIEQSAPGMLAWENRTHNGQAYVRVGLSEEARADAGDDPSRDAALYYAAMPRAITLSMSEDVVRRAVEREQARRVAPDDGGQARAASPGPFEPWLGESLALRFTDEGLGLIEGPGGETLRFQMQSRCWGNLPILNEWRRLFPSEDPVGVHERLWGVRLVCPGGGDYAWDEPYRTMASGALGHPGTPRPGPGGLGPLGGITSGSLGVTFEENGLRARAEIQREGGER